MARISKTMLPIVIGICGAVIGISALTIAALSVPEMTSVLGSSVGKNYVASYYYIVKNNSSSNKTLIGNNIGMMNMTHENMMAMKEGMTERGNIAMGFNQSKIMHYFIASPSGGEIMIVALNNSDANTIKQINNHVIDIQKDFSEGNFTKPFFIHAQQVPGTKLMTERKDQIK